MSEFKTLPLDKILVPERLRVVEDDHALAIQASIIEHGLINPITVRSTPRAARPYTLVAGAHRLRAYDLADDDWSREIEAMVIEGDKDEATLVEITENLFRNDLSALDRATFVMSYREVWERKHGKVEAGRPGNRVNVTQLIADEAARGFSTHVANRLGCSTESLKLLTRIGKNLQPDLRQQLRGSPEADNQALLLKLAKMEPQRQRQIAAAYRGERDISKALATTEPNAKAHATKTIQQEVFDRLAATWERADETTRAKFLEHIGATTRKPRQKLPTPSELLDEAASEDVSDETDGGAMSRALNLLGEADL